MKRFRSRSRSGKLQDRCWGLRWSLTGSGTSRRCELLHKLSRSDGSSLMWSGPASPWRCSGYVSPAAISGSQWLKTVECEGFDPWSFSICTARSASCTMYGRSLKKSFSQDRDLFSQKLICCFWIPPPLPLREQETTIANAATPDTRDLLQY